jgi:hypothetical protein
MVRAGELLGLTEESFGIREPLLEAAGGSLCRLAPDGDVTGCKSRGKVRLKKRERFLVQPLLF